MSPSDFDHIPGGESNRDNIKRWAAQQRRKDDAVRRPERPRGEPTAGTLHGWLDGLLRGCTDDVRHAQLGTRNETLNACAYRIGRHVHLGIDRNVAVRELMAACESNGYTSEKEHGTRDFIARNIKRMIGDGENDPAQTPERKPGAPQADTAMGETEPKAKRHDRDEAQRTITMRRYSGVKITVPQWVWEYDNVGRLQLGTLSMFAGKPAAGKSTAVRWFAAQLSRGLLPGCWYGTPMNVAVVMNEEQNDAVVAPGLLAAGADLNRVFYPEFRCGETESGLMAIADEQRLTEELLQAEIGALFVDPIMSTIGSGADVNRNNEVRAALNPFTRIAKAINGVVIGVAHLRKGEVRNVMEGINGSGAFGEVPRAVFGFAPTDAGEHVMEQVKNSAGPTDLRLVYHLPVAQLETQDGELIELPRFEITGTTEVSIADINPYDDETTDISVACNWLYDYLMENPDTASSEVKRDAKIHGDIKEHTLKRAMQRIGVVVTTTSKPGTPRLTVWNLPEQVA